MSESFIENVNKVANNLENVQEMVESLNSFEKFKGKLTIASNVIAGESYYYNGLIWYAMMDCVNVLPGVTDGWANYWASANVSAVASVPSFDDLALFTAAGFTKINLTELHPGIPGSGGNFVYYPTVDKSTANADTIIDHTVSLTSQGSGIGLGCWVYHPGKLGKDLDDVEGRATSLEGRATSLEGRATSLEGRATSLEGRATTNEADIADLFAGQNSGVVVFQTYAELDAYTPIDTTEEKGSFKVVNDPDSSLNGYYSWDTGTIYIKDASLVVNTIDKDNTSDAVSGAAVAEYINTEIDEALDEVLEEDFSLDEEKLYAILDANNRELLIIDKRGKLHANYEGFESSAEEHVDNDLQVITDANGRILIRIDRYGNLYSKESRVSTESSMDEVETARGNRVTLDARLSEYINPYGLMKQHEFGEWYMRETRQRTRKLLLSESSRLVVASIGDSWTHNAPRYTRATSDTLKTTYGNGGVGWTGFAWGFGGASEIGSGMNGNVTDKVSVTLSANWAVHYAASVSPDICDIYTSTAGASITCVYADTAVVSACVLYYIANTGSLRYRFDAGEWTTIDTSVGTGLTAASLLNVPAGEFTLEIENVSGEITVCGVDIQSASDGVVWHKLGATGSRALQWVSVDSTKWKSGLVSLTPNLITILHGTNDQSSYSPTTYAGYVQTLITRCKEALPLADILLIAPCENGRVNTYPMSEYAYELYKLAASNKCGFLDLQYVFGEEFSEYSSTSDRNWFNVDLIHPEPSTGGRVIVDALYRYLTK